MTFYYGNNLYTKRLFLYILFFNFLQESKYEKMDKADILEMAVRHLVDSQRSHLSGTYRAGYNRCAAEVKGYLHRTPSNSQDVQKRLLGYLTHGCGGSSSSSTRGGICRPQPIMPHTANISSTPVRTDGEHKVTLVARQSGGGTTCLPDSEDDTYLNCSTVSSTSSCSSTSALSPIRERRDSVLSEDYSPDRCGGLESVGGGDVHDYNSSAFRKVQAVAEAGSRAACGRLGDYALDSDEDSELRSRDLQVVVDGGSSPVWRPW